jgi:hypothetical protein
VVEVWTVIRFPWLRKCDEMKEKPTAQFASGAWNQWIYYRPVCTGRSWNTGNKRHSGKVLPPITKAAGLLLHTVLNE